ncbi:hypothetical protein ACFYO2_46230 [Streptomyces sp. NPDC006602]|uniref:hypothetical protein n=1 Tax=Streptomyces sp. NPDC006602 TaxID=3364751 RepID=UPI0036C6CEE0
MTSGQFFFMLHLTLGVLFLHAYAGGMATLLRTSPTPLQRTVRTWSTAGLAVVAWATVISGTWLVYPDYRAEPEPGAGLVDYPKASLMADPATEVWHHFGMEWKEHVGWIVPFIATAVAYLAIRHRDLLEKDKRVRRVTTVLFTLAFLISVVAAGLGSVINAVAPNQFLGH